MKKLNVFLVLLLFSIIGFAEQSQYKVISVGFYNCENLFDTIDQLNVQDEEFTPNGDKHYTGDIYWDKISKLSDVISLIGTEYSKEGVALLGVAEIENRDVLIDLANSEKLKDRNYQIIHYDGPYYRGVDCALFYNPKYFKPISSHPITVDLSKVIENAYTTRDILYVKGLLDGEEVHVFVNHWPSRRGGEEASAPLRNYAAQLCKNAIDSIYKENKNAKIILMGDLNDNPTNECMTKVLACKDKQEKTASDGMYNPWVDFYKKGIGTTAYRDSWSLFDQIVVSGNYLTKNNSSNGYFYHKAQIINEPFMIQKTGQYKGYPKRTWDWALYNGGYSDHFPTCIYLLKKM
ncbi:MAG: endonuclease/exonuclease/phosphatase family protein [Chitinophagales bacterium]|nr:endonuclease/exonuclease/phosphatase family protein [Chitinophagales bacterium]